MLIFRCVRIAFLRTGCYAPASTIIFVVYTISCKAMILRVISLGSNLLQFEQKIWSIGKDLETILMSYRCNLIQCRKTILTIYAHLPIVSIQFRKHSYSSQIVINLRGGVHIEPLPPPIKHKKVCNIKIML